MAEKTPAASNTCLLLNSSFFYTVAALLIQFICLTENCLNKALSD